MTRRDAFGTFAPLQSPRRGQPSYREIAEEQAKSAAPPIEADPDLPETTAAAGREAIIALLLSAAFLAGAVAHWLIP